ncbi:hypothetical protein GCM10012319_64910 [Comamonas sp. KCTC 72670]|nr:hypothetical protein GCM10012319_64910 [Comamonas sp. KCTC 72670]
MGPIPPELEPFFSSLTAETFLKRIRPWLPEKPGPGEKGGALYTRAMSGGSQMTHTPFAPTLQP